MSRFSLLPRIRFTIFSLYVLPGSKSCANQSRITVLFAAATGIDCRRPSTTNARSTLRTSSGASANSVDVGRVFAWRAAF